MSLLGVYYCYFFPFNVSIGFLLEGKTIGHEGLVLKYGHLYIYHAQNFQFYFFIISHHQVVEWWCMTILDKFYKKFCLFYL